MNFILTMKILTKRKILVHSDEPKHASDRTQKSWSRDKPVYIRKDYNVGMVLDDDVCHCLEKLIAELFLF